MSSSAHKTKKKKKSVRMSVDFGVAEGEEEQTSSPPPPSVSVAPSEVQIRLQTDEGEEAFPNGGDRVASTANEVGKLSLSETDPALVLAASIFVDELIRQAAIEVDKRLAREGREDEVSRAAL